MKKIPLVSEPYTANRKQYFDCFHFVCKHYIFLNMLENNQKRKKMLGFHHAHSCSAQGQHIQY